MIKKLLLPLLLCLSSMAGAETIKTDVLVVGNGVSGVAAAIQSARSKVKTMLIRQGAWTTGQFASTGWLVTETDKNLQAGIWGEFRKKVQDHYKTTAGYDTSRNAVLRFEPAVGAELLKIMTDTIKGLTVKINSPWTAIQKNGTGWDVTITLDGKTDVIKTKVLIDATEQGDLAAKAGVTLVTAVDNKPSWKLCRTAIAAGEVPKGEQFTGNAIFKIVYQSAAVYYIPLNALILKNTDNLFVSEKWTGNNSNAQYLPLKLKLGQGIGCTAAYCAFFKTTTKNLKVRTVQGELLDFRGNLLPLEDILPTDRNWRPIQQVCATGLLKGLMTANGALKFDGDAAVYTAEIKPVLTEIYTCAFLWFNKEKTGEKFTVGNMLSLVSEMTLTDPQVLTVNTQKAWKAQYGFKTDFDVNRPISRLEFTVLTNKFLNPFARTVDLEGRLIN